MTDRNNNDDDEDELVRQVIKENPVAERGIREEWEQHIGWHRQEDIHAKKVSSDHHNHYHHPNLNSTTHALRGNSFTILDKTSQMVPSRMDWLRHWSFFLILVLLLVFAKIIPKIRQQQQQQQQYKQRSV